MQNLGSFLREKRRAKGLSLEQVSEELRIKLSFLQALEEEKYEILPSPLYKRIFLKAYSDYLGLNFEELLGKFSVGGAKAKEEESPSVPVVRTEVRVPEPEVSRKGKIDYNSWLVIAGILLGVMVILLFIMHQQIYKYDQEIGPGIKEVRLGPFVPLPDSGKLKPRLPSGEEVEQIPSQSDKLTLRLEGLEDTWARIVGDGDTLFAGLIKAGTQVEYQARDRFTLTLGKSLGVRGYLNGELLKPLGRTGRTVFGREINRENYRNFLDTTATE